MFGPALLLLATLSTLGTITTANPSAAIQHETFLSQPLNRHIDGGHAPLRSGPRLPALTRSAHQLGGDAQKPHHSKPVKEETSSLTFENRQILEARIKKILARICRMKILGTSVAKLSSAWPELSLCRGLHLNNRRRRRELPFSPFSTTVSAWNDFETDYYPVYDWLPKLLIPVLLLLPLLGLLVKAAITLGSLVASEKELRSLSSLDSLSSLAEDVWRAIDKQRASFED
ncbi:uncharacterized protein LOC122366954 [Amphibalanus amphitrite]|uniref:uncharacterized protein LOC122366954 n=1 Tax=Amphibalanus amphitrite TaxID=1232801 RepID=UPI001C9141F1|nr:uncharacterized protein LOC122366954 [Amphibalanus amphitrite]